MERHQESHGTQGGHEAHGPEHGVDHVEVGAGGGREDRHGQVGVDILQVAANGRLAEKKQI